MNRQVFILFTYFLSLLFLLTAPCLVSADENASQLVKSAIDYLRDASSYSEVQMTIRRKDFERSASFKGWTLGTDHSLVRFTAPAKDSGNASLTKEKKMWSFSPKTNRVIKIPPSMMGQSWMGSDFSYNDLTKSDDIVRQYRHTFIGKETHQGKAVRVVEAIPLEDAPVVWGKEILKIREDNIIIDHQFYDQDGKLIKELEVLEIEPIGGKLYGTKLRMSNVEEGNRWTQLRYTNIQFGVQVPKWVFTVSNLRNPREK